MKIVIIGQGAVGLLWYYNLHKLDHDVSLLCSKSVRTIPSKLTYIDTKQQQFSTSLNQASVNDLNNADIILFCLKAYQLQNAFQDYLNEETHKAPLILCHNGMLKKEHLPKKHSILALLLTHGAKKTSHFTVEHTGLGQSDLGVIQGKLNQSEQTLISHLFSSALPDVYWHSSIKEKQWIKLAINCVINPITAIYNCDNGNITQNNYSEIIDYLLDEIVLVANKHQLILSTETLKEIVFNVAIKTSKNTSSMRNDIILNRKTEIDHINGFICQQGELFKIATPYNEQMWQQVKYLERTSTKGDIL